VGEATQQPAKLEVARVMLLRGSVFIHLDPRVEGVAVPPWFRGHPQLVLQVGLDMAVPILDLMVDKDGVRGTLSFNHSPWFCSIPWDAVFALQDDNGKGMVWPEALPEEIQDELAREAGIAPPPEPSAALLEALMDDEDEDEAPRRPSLRVVEGGGEPEPEAASPATPVASRVPHLRLVKS